MTVHNTPIVKDILHVLAKWILRLLGWKVTGRVDPFAKGVFIGAPHTSNWDFPLMIMAILVWRVDVRWVGKHTLFLGPMGPMMRWFGGIAIDRRAKQNFVEQMSERFIEEDSLYVLIAPEGTRAAAEQWRTGFYYTALNAQVPLVMSFIDYKNKELGIAGLESPSGDAAADIARYHAFYSRKTGKYPQNFSLTLRQD